MNHTEAEEGCGGGHGVKHSGWERRSQYSRLSLENSAGYFFATFLHCSRHVTAVYGLQRNQKTHMNARSSALLNHCGIS